MNHISRFDESFLYFHYSFGGPQYTSYTIQDKAESIAIKQAGETLKVPRDLCGIKFPAMVWLHFVSSQQLGCAAALRLDALDDHKIFLSYHRPDYRWVESIKLYLQERGIRVFIDRDALCPGFPWPAALEESLNSADAVIVFVGPSGLGGWQKRELFCALDRQVREERAYRTFPVIPVLLPAANEPESGFLFLNKWIDLRRGIGDSQELDALAQSVIGKSPALAVTQQYRSICPYRGLSSFREEHAPFFFGREIVTKRLLEATLRQKLVALVGPSGSGKSSIVHAGLLPLLHRCLPPETTWDSISFTPGDSPFHNLASAMLPCMRMDLSEVDRMAEARKMGEHLACSNVQLEAVIRRILKESNGTERFLIIVDQFEELFTLTSADNRQKFARALLDPLSHVPLTLLLTLRADFYSQAIALDRELSDLLECGVINIGNMNREELQRAITEPARRVGLSLEPGLAERILDDVGQEPGNLPLLEFALTEMWASSEGAMLTHALYEKRGKVAGAIAYRAEAAFGKLDLEQQKNLRRVFTRLIKLARPSEGEEDARKWASASDLTQEESSVARALTDTRLLVVDRSQASGEVMISLAHEALIKNWLRLCQWLDEDREFLLWRQRLGNAVEQWLETDRDNGALLRGAALTEAEKWLAKRVGDFEPTEREFIENSLSLHREEARAKTRRKAIIARAAITTSVFFLILAATAGFFWQRAAREKHRSDSRRLATQALACLESRLDLALLLARESYRIDRNVESMSSLLAALEYSPKLQTFLRGHDSFVSDVFICRDGTLASIDNQGSIYFWDISSRRRIMKYSCPESLRGYAFCAARSPDRRRMAIFRGGWIRMWDLIKRKEIGHFPAEGFHYIEKMAFSPDGHTLAAASLDKIAVWDLNSFRQKALADIESGNIAGVDFSSNGKILIIASMMGTIDFRSASTLKTTQPFISMPGPGNHAFVVSPDGKIMAAGVDDSVILFDMETHRELGVPVSNAGESIWTLRFSPDSKTLATGHSNGKIDLFSVEKQNQLGQALLGQGSLITSMDFDTSGTILASTSGKTIVLWNISKECRIGQPLPIPSQDGTLQQVHEARGVTATQDGNLVATCGGAFSYWGSIYTWNPQANKASVYPDLHHASVSTIAISPDGRLLATATDGDSHLMAFESNPMGHRTIGGIDYSIVLWDLKKEENVYSILSHESNIGPVNQVAFSPDGRKLASCGCAEYADSISGGSGMEDSLSQIEYYPLCSKGLIRIWGIESEKHDYFDLRGHSKQVRTIAFSPDGTKLASGSEDGSIIIWNLLDRNQICSIKAHEMAINSVSFDPAGEILASAGYDGNIFLWNAHTGSSLGAPLTLLTPGSYSITGIVNSLAFNHTGEILASARVDGKVILWHVPSRQQLGTPLLGHSGSVNGVAFAQEGKLLVSGAALQQISDDRGHSPEGYRYVGDLRFTGNLVVLWNMNIERWLSLAGEIANRELTDSERRQYIGN